MTHILDTAWRHSVSILEQDLLRHSAHIANAANRRPREVDFEKIRLAKKNLEEALEHEPR